MKTTFGCSEAHTEVHKTYFVVWNFFMKPKAGYKNMDMQMLIGLAMFQIEGQLVVSCFFLEVVLLFGVVRNNQHIHY